MSVVRKLCSGVVWLWMLVVDVCKKIIGRSKRTELLPSSQVGNVGTSPATGQEMEWEESWNTMETFSVKVEQSDNDLFQDMQPVLTKTRKMYVRGEKSEETRPVTADRQKFAVETTFTSLDTGGELGEWKEEGGGGGGGGWEGETGREEGILVMASREAIAQQKREEREKRRKLQEALRFNQRLQLQQQSLFGVKVSESS